MYDREHTGISLWSKAKFPQYHSISFIWYRFIYTIYVFIYTIDMV